MRGVALASTIFEIHGLSLEFNGCYTPLWVHGGAGMSARVKVLIGAAVIVAALIWLGFVGFQESKAYYVTVDEYSSMQGTMGSKTLKLAGEVQVGSIDRSKIQMEFVLGNGDKKIRVRYVGRDIIPDTFKDGTKALVEGKAGSDGVFQATHIEAKCASKYETEYERKTAQ
jgi:cytochrome c-type biogenesis protein CcmE